MNERENKEDRRKRGVLGKESEVERLGPEHSTSQEACWAVTMLCSLRNNTIVNIVTSLSVGRILSN